MTSFISEGRTIARCYLHMGFSSNRRKRVVVIKNAVFFFFLFLALFIKVPAQVRYGVKAGITISSFYFPGGTPIPYDDYDIDLRPYLGYDVQNVQTNPQNPLLSPYFGVFGRVKLNDRWIVQPELGFSQKGVDFSSSGNENVSYQVRITYLEMPLSFSYQYLQKEKVLSHLYMGGYAAYKINAIKKVGSSDNTTEKTDLNSVKDFDFGVHAGLDFMYRLNKHFFLLDIRFFLGLQDILFVPENWTNLYYETHKTKITGFTISMGYEF